MEADPETTPRRGGGPRNSEPSPPTADVYLSPKNPLYKDVIQGCLLALGERKNGEGKDVVKEVAREALLMFKNGMSGQQTRFFKPESRSSGKFYLQMDDVEALEKITFDICQRMKTRTQWIDEKTAALDKITTGVSLRMAPTKFQGTTADGNGSASLKSPSPQHPGTSQHKAMPVFGYETGKNLPAKTATSTSALPPSNLLTQQMPKSTNRNGKKRRPVHPLFSRRKKKRKAECCKTSAVLTNASKKAQRGGGPNEARPIKVETTPMQLAAKTAPTKAADFNTMAIEAPPAASSSMVASAPSNGNFKAQSGSSSNDNTVDPGLFGTLYYEAPTAKPFPPGIAKDSVIALPNSICHIPADAYLQEEVVPEQCKICLDSLTVCNESPVSLNACGHILHRHCLRETMKHQCSFKCPECRVFLLSDRDRITYSRGDMPSGTLSWKTRAHISCTGYEGCGSICMSYNIPSSDQKSYHPNPGQLHRSAHRRAYLPNNQGGHELLSRLQVAFLCGLTFNVGTSLTTNRDNSVTWASIHHKTSPTGGIERHGYPDESYVANCNAELDAAGVPPSPICAEYVGQYEKSMAEVARGKTRGISDPSTRDRDRQMLLFHLIHAQHCKSGGAGPCLVVDQCSKFKALVRHVQHCIDDACDFHECAKAKIVMDHFAKNFPQCQSRRRRPGCQTCGLVRLAMAGARNISKSFGELKYQDLRSYVRISNLPADRSDANFFYQQHVREVFDVSEGSRSRHLSSMLSKINSEDFKQFLEQDELRRPSVEMNPHMTSAMCQSFVEEGMKCGAEADNFHIRVVFHGTPEVNIESILRNGLDQSKRKGQAYGPGEYFSSSPAKCARHCRGGKRIIAFAVITTDTDIRTREIVVVEEPQRQLPIATLLFESIDSFGPARRKNAYLRDLSKRQMADALPRNLLDEKIEKEKLANEAREKGNIIRLLLQNSYQSASDIYKKACNAKNSGMPPQSWAREVAMYVRDHIRDEVDIAILFPNLPPRPIDASEVTILNIEKCEADANEARRKYESLSKGKVPGKSDDNVSPHLAKKTKTSNESPPFLDLSAIEGQPLPFLQHSSKENGVFEDRTGSAAPSGEMNELWGKSFFSV